MQIPTPRRKRGFHPALNLTVLLAFVGFLWAYSLHLATDAHCYEPAGLPDTAMLAHVGLSHPDLPSDGHHHHHPDGDQEHPAHPANDHGLQFTSKDSTFTLDLPCLVQDSLLLPARAASSRVIPVFRGSFLSGRCAGPPCPPRGPPAA